MSCARRRHTRNASKALDFAALLKLQNLMRTTFERETSDALCRSHGFKHVVPKIQAKPCIRSPIGVCTRRRARNQWKSPITLGTRPRMTNRLGYRSPLVPGQPAQKQACFCQSGAIQRHTRIAPKIVAFSNTFVCAKPHVHTKRRSTSEKLRVLETPVFAKRAAFPPARRGKNEPNT